ncbi:helix-turn-helix transcriptional regulator [Dinoroseobacter sp. S124A]|uniref:helix-turn-helix transcriptional regulator n=1 Tax=Dinoroseobacter sp. S124A TaxID=3415128 RepID=UPI003C79F29E
MRRSERLAEIIEILRDGRLHRAQDMAERLEVSLRTIYRDLETLIATGIPVEGARGLGYMLREPVLFSALNLSLTELEALHLGMAIVAEGADPELQEAAQSLARKVAQAAPIAREAPPRWGHGVYPFTRARAGFAHMPLLRRAIRGRELVEITYHALEGTVTTREIQPLQMEYWGAVWTLTSWCRLRTGFRVFRTDRIVACRGTGQHFEVVAGQSLADYLAMLPEESP